MVGVTMVCTFFGHRDAPDAVEEKLYEVLRELIENRSVETFYVGNQGKFDAIVAKVLKTLKTQYPHIRCLVILAYIPNKNKNSYYDEFFDTLYPEGLENTPPKFAILRRNKWLIENSDMVVTYVRNPWGGASQSREYALKCGKIVVDLA